MTISPIEGPGSVRFRYLKVQCSTSLRNLQISLTAIAASVSAISQNPRRLLGMRINKVATCPTRPIVRDGHTLVVTNPAYARVSIGRRRLACPYSSRAFDIKSQSQS